MVRSVRNQLVSPGARGVTEVHSHHGLTRRRNSRHLIAFYAAGRTLSAALAHIARHDRHGAAFIAHTGDMICTSSRPASYEGARSIYGLEGGGPAPGRSPLVPTAWTCPGTTSRATPTTATPAEPGSSPVDPVTGCSTIAGRSRVFVFSVWIGGHGRPTPTRWSRAPSPG